MVSARVLSKMSSLLPPEGYAPASAKHQSTGLPRKLPLDPEWRALARQNREVAGRFVAPLLPA